jgi:NAD(P)H-nitrite reductase large subunit
MADTVIIGTGIAGMSALKAISEKEPKHRVVLVGDEDRLPYKRTKLSKNIARGFSRDEFALQDADWFSERNVDLKLGRRVLAIDPRRRTVVLDGDERICWRQLIIATGARARMPEVSGHALDHCRTVRQAGDVENLLEALDGKQSVLVVGAGVLGVEIAEQLWAKGHEVTLISSGSSVMPRELNPAAERTMRELLDAAEIELRLKHRIVSVNRAGGAADGIRVRTSAGELTADQVVFAVGSVPETQLAVDAGVEVADGVLVDEFLETSVKGVFAAGDVAQQRSGAVSHLWHEAEAQGRCAGLNAIGPPLAYIDTGYRLKCEVFGHYFFSMGRKVGRPDPADEKTHEIIEDIGSPYRCFYFQDSRLAGAVMVDDGKRSKEYESAVRQGLSETQVRELFLS